MDQPNNGNTCGTGCGCGHHRVGAIAVILIGVAFLLEALGVLTANATGIIWPILLIIAAAGKLCKCCGK